MSHQQKSRFFSMARTYNDLCHDLVPKYRWYQEALLELLPDNADAAFRLVDLGAGSGLFLQAVLRKYPNATCYWVDFSNDFREVAEENLAAFSSRVEYVLLPMEHDWESRVGGDVDYIVSMSAIHHLESHEKRKLYARCHAALIPGGLFVNLDEMKTVHKDAYLESLRKWAAHVDNARSSIPDSKMQHYERFTANFERWKRQNIDEVDRPRVKGDDIHESFLSQMEWLREAHFIDVELFFKYHLWCAIGGRKAGNGQGETNRVVE